jgi:hypothetical protein
MDDNRLFMDKESLNLVDDLYRTHTSHDAASTHLKDSVGEEIARERIFKTEVF